MATPASKSSLSIGSPKASDARPHKIQDYHNLALHPPNLTQGDTARDALPTVEPINIEVEDHQHGFVPGFLHLPPAFEKGETQAPNQTAAILLSGAGGGVVGPSGIYLSIADKLASLNKGIPSLRLDYRFPARNRYCVPDVVASMDLLQELYVIRRFVLVGWSFGGAPVFTVGGRDKRVIGCATVASQTAETEGIRQLAPRPLLLLHGKADRTLSPACSERLYDMYGQAGNRKIHLFDGDDHALSRNAETAEEMLCQFIIACTGEAVSESEKKGILEKEMFNDGDRLRAMKEGGDLRPPEHID